MDGVQEFRREVLDSKLDSPALFLCHGQVNGHVERIRLFIGVFVQTATQHRLRVGAREELWLALANQVIADYEQFGKVRLDSKVIVEEIKRRLELSRHFFLFLPQFCRVKRADRNLELAKNVAGNDLIGIQEAKDVIHLRLQPVISE